MLMPLERWEQVRDWFTEDERAAIHLATTAETPSTRGIIIEEAQLGMELRAKLAFHFPPAAAQAAGAN
jgi:hypothetical protein